MLSQLAVDIMCCPVSTAMQERISSTAGIACGNRRQRLTGEQLEREVFITKNYQYYG